MEQKFGEPIPRIFVSSVQCPKCGADEMHPDGDKLLIRAFKVETDGHWWSQCLVCAGYYNGDLNADEQYAAYDESKGDPKLGWF